MSAKAEEGHADVNRKVERCNAWLKAYRRLRIRHEWYAQNFLGLVHLARALVLLRAILK